MQFEPASSKRVQIGHSHNGVTITVRAKVRLFGFAFLTVWLCGWTAGGVFAANSLLTGDAFGEARIFLAFWLCGWALGWLFAVFALLWMLGGKEQLMLQNAGLTKRISVWLLGRSRHYDLNLVSKVRKNASLKTTSPNANLDSPFGKNGRIAFDYGQKTVTFGAGIDDAETDLILSALKTRLGSRRMAA